MRTPNINYKKVEHFGRLADQLLAKRARNAGPAAVINGPDRVGFVGFHHQAFVVATFANPTDPKFVEKVHHLGTRVGGGGTNIAAGIRRSVELLRGTNPGTLRRIWLLSDGEPTHEVGGPIFAAVSEARCNFININVIGFGDRFDGKLLRKIAAGTHNGQFFSAKDIRQLNAILHSQIKRIPGGRRRVHRAENTIYAIDCSLSMNDPMGHTTKMGVVQQSLSTLLVHKRRMFG